MFLQKTASTMPNLQNPFLPCAVVTPIMKITWLKKFLGLCVATFNARFLFEKYDPSQCEWVGYYDTLIVKRASILAPYQWQNGWQKWTFFSSTQTSKARHRAKNMLKPVIYEGFLSVIFNSHTDETMISLWAWIYTVRLLMILLFWSQKTNAQCGHTDALRGRCPDFKDQISIKGLKKCNNLAYGGK